MNVGFIIRRVQYQLGSVSRDPPGALLLPRSLGTLLSGPPGTLLLPRSPGDLPGDLPGGSLVNFLVPGAGSSICDLS